MRSSGMVRLWPGDQLTVLDVGALAGAAAVGVGVAVGVTAVPVVTGDALVGCVVGNGVAVVLAEGWSVGVADGGGVAVCDGVELGGADTEGVGSGGCGVGVGVDISCVRSIRHLLTIVYRQTRSGLQTPTRHGTDSM